MAIGLEKAIAILDNFLDDPSRIGKTKDAIDVIILSSDDPEEMQMVTEALCIIPDDIHLEPLWGLVRRTSADEEMRGEAMRSISAILVSADAILSIIEEEGDEDEDPLLTREQIEAQVDDMLAVYRDESQPGSLRRKGLEIASSVRNDDEILAAGRAALEEGDETWLATGLYVLRNLQTDDVLDLCRTYIKHESQDVRIEAIQGLAELGGEAEYKIVADLIFDGSGESQIVTMWALTEVPTPEAGDILKEAAGWLEGEAGDEAKAAYQQWIENLPIDDDDDDDDESEESCAARLIDKYDADAIDDDDDAGGFDD